MSSNEPRARRTDPGTSHEAARHARKTYTEQQQAVIEVMRLRGTPMLGCEIAEWSRLYPTTLNLDYYQVMRQMAPLERLGTVHKTGVTRPNHNGLQANEYALGRGSSQPDLFKPKPRETVSSLREQLAEATARCLELEAQVRTLRKDD